MNRRNFIQSAGVLSIFVAGGTVWRAIDQGVFSSSQGQAYQEWTNWQSQKSAGLLGLVHSAILAASPHNSQPWLFKISTSSIDLYADTKRHVGAIDPFLREMYMGVGCALENLLLAAKANGYSYQLRYFPSPADPSLAASIVFKKDQATVSTLYHAIPHRHTNRGAHDTMRPISTNIMNALSMLANELTHVKLVWLDKKTDRSHFFDLIEQATNEIILDEQQSKSSFHWLRKNWQELQDKKDGVSIDTTGISPALRAIAKILPSISRESSDQYFLGAMKKQRDQTDMIGIIMVKNNRDNTHRLQGGRYWQRMHLWGTTERLAMQPVNQIPERIDRNDSLGKKSIFVGQMHGLLNQTQWQVLMPFRIGHPLQEALPSPRRHVNDVVI